MSWYCEVSLTKSWTAAHLSPSKSWSYNPLQDIILVVLFRIFESKDYLWNKVAVFHSSFLSTCEKRQSVKSVYIGHYVLPPASVQDGEDYVYWFIVSYTKSVVPNLAVKTLSEVPRLVWGGCKMIKNMLHATQVQILNCFTCSGFWKLFKGTSHSLTELLATHRHNELLLGSLLLWKTLANHTNNWLI